MISSASNGITRRMHYMFITILFPSTYLLSSWIYTPPTTFHKERRVLIWRRPPTDAHLPTVVFNVNLIVPISRSTILRLHRSLPSWTLVNWGWHIRSCCATTNFSHCTERGSLRMSPSTLCIRCGTGKDTIGHLLLHCRDLDEEQKLCGLPPNEASLYTLLSFKKKS